MSDFNNVFLSYSSPESLGLAAIIHQQLKLSNYDVWFDKTSCTDINNIEEEKESAIEDSDSFVFIITPASIRSYQTLSEVVHALSWHKKITLLLQYNVSDEDWMYAAEQARTDEKDDLAGEIISCVDYLLSVDWINIRQEKSDIDKINKWDNEYIDSWSSHNDIEYLKRWECPIKEKAIDNFSAAFTKLLSRINRGNENAVRYATIQNQAIAWDRHGHAEELLLPDKELKEVEDWIDADYSSDKVPELSDLETDYIKQSINTTDYKEVFISYGRAESLAFAARLHQRIRSKSYNKSVRKETFDVWFDKVNIPHGDEYQQRINNGIENAQNFVFVISPHAIRSKYCLLEITHAIKCGKRIIPVLHLEPEAADWNHAACTERENGNDELAKTFDNCINRLQSIDWIYAREKKGDLIELQQWRDSYENSWKLHNKDEYLAGWQCPVVWDVIDYFEEATVKIMGIIDTYTSYVFKHTQIFNNALIWKQNQKSTHYLQVGKERTDATEWLLAEFIPPKQPPCKPTALHCEYICESRKNAENMMCDVFICCFADDKYIRDQVIQSLSYYAITSWSHDRDIYHGSDYEKAIDQGIEQADNFFFFISPDSVKSHYCIKELKLAQKHNKRITPLYISETDFDDVPEELSSLQYVDFTDNIKQKDYDNDIDDILNILHHDKQYYEQHKILLSRAIKWEKENQKTSFLLRGFNLENATTWLRISKDRAKHSPTTLHEKYINASIAAKGQLETEVFISYSRKDGDFARILNTELQHAGKTTWFDQESISSGVNFEKEIFKGISASNNFLFIISPDSVKSEYCEREVNYALENNKRFITILHRDVYADLIPETLRTINWIDFAKKTFAPSFSELIQAVELDREHARMHTILQQRANEWNENGQHSDLLMNKTATENSEKWLSQAMAIALYKKTNDCKDFFDLIYKKIKTYTEQAQEVGISNQNTGIKQPTPTFIQAEFIDKSRNTITIAEKREKERQNKILLLEKQKRQKQRTMMAIMAIGLVISISMMLFGLNKANEAEKSLEIANCERQKADSANIIAVHARDTANLLRVSAEEDRIKAENANKNAEKYKSDADHAEDDAKAEIYKDVLNSMTISALKTNFLYAGVYNPLKVAVSGVPSSEIQLKHGKKRILVDSKGNFDIKVQKNRDVTLTVYAPIKNNPEEKIGSITFKVKRIPDPTPTINSKRGGVIKRYELSRFKRIEAVLNDFDFDIHFWITSCVISYPDKNGYTEEIKVTSNRIGETINTILSKNSRVTSISFDKIKCSGSDGTKRKLESIAFRVK